MKKLQNSIEERIRVLLSKEKKRDEEVYFSYSDYDMEITMVFNRNDNSACAYICDGLFLKFDTCDSEKTLLDVSNKYYTHKELMENIKIIHNNLKKEENWEEIL